MENFSYYSPTLFEFGRGAEEKVGMLTFLTGASKLLIVYGRKYAKTNGLIDRITNSLDTLGIEHVELGGVEPNPTDTLVYEGIKLARAKKSTDCWPLVVDRSSTPPKPSQQECPTKATSGISTKARPR